MRLVRRGSCLLAALLLAVSPLLATPAAAHNPPPVPTPADGATLESAPAEVRLDYSAPILSVGSVLEVTGPDGAKVSDGPSVIGEKDVVQAITDGGPGTYTVVWRVTSEDGHPVDGTSSFTVEATTTEEPTTTPAGTTPPAEATTTPAPTTQAPTTPAPTATATPAPEDGSNLLVRGGAVVLGLAALAAVVLVVRRMRA